MEEGLRPLLGIQNDMKEKVRGWCIKRRKYGRAVEEIVSKGLISEDAKERLLR